MRSKIDRKRCRSTVMLSYWEESPENSDDAGIVNVQLSGNDGKVRSCLHRIVNLAGRGEDTLASPAHAEVVLSDTTSVPDPSGVRRLPELDAVRGIASLTVVLYHFLLMWAPSDFSLLPAWQRAALFLLRPFYAGSEAVILFFVLSGLVLSLPYLHGRGQSYPIYLFRRILRIYGPYLAALALALAGAAVWHGHPYRREWVASAWSQPISLKLVGQHIAFLGVYETDQYDFVVWSLVQELRISIIFPFLLALVMRIGGTASILLGVLCSGIALHLVPAYPAISALYSLGTTLHYMACFIAGILLASNLDRVALWWKLTSFRTHLILAAGSLGAYAYQTSAMKRLSPILLHRPYISTSSSMIVSNWITMIGALGLIVLALNASAGRRILNRRMPQFLGNISYSLYLVHPIVLLALTFACGDRVSAWIQFPAYAALSILLAWAFSLAVEKPFIRWSRSIGSSRRIIT